MRNGTQQKTDKFSTSFFLREVLRKMTGLHELIKALGLLVHSGGRGNPKATMDSCYFGNFEFSNVPVKKM